MRMIICSHVGVFYMLKYIILDLIGNSPVCELFPCIIDSRNDILKVYYLFPHSSPSMASTSSKIASYSSSTTRMTSTFYVLSAPRLTSRRARLSRSFYQVSADPCRSTLHRNVWSLCVSLDSVCLLTNLSLEINSTSYL